MRGRPIPFNGPPNQKVLPVTEPIEFKAADDIEQCSRLSAKHIILGSHSSLQKCKNP